MIIKQEQIRLVRQINDIFKGSDKPISLRLLIEKLKKKVFWDRYSFFSLFNLMLENELIKKLKNGKFVLSYEWVPGDLSQTIVGKVSLLLSGSAFIKVTDSILEKEVKYFVHKSNVNGAIEGDVVKAALIVKKDIGDEFKSQEAAIIKINEHTKTKFVGTFLVDKNKPLGYEVIPDSFQTFLKIQLHDLNGLSNGDKIYFEIDQFFPTYVKARVLKRIGNYRDLFAEVESFLTENDVALTFPKPVIEESKKIYTDCLKNQVSLHWPKINLPFITIDPKTAMDYDDAIYVKKNLDGSYRLAVAIAAVSDYVKTDSFLDQCAKKRGCSIYLWNQVIPMLPPCLSDDLCSLNENAPKKVYIADMQINDHGCLVKYEVYPGIIQNYRRCTYSEINDLIQQNFKPTASVLDATIAELVKDAFELSSVLGMNNSKRGLISFDLPEVKPYYDPVLDEVKVVIKVQGTAEKMIENFMVAANEAVTLFATQHKLPFIYRVHSGTNKELIPDFLKAIKKLGVVGDSTVDFYNITPKELSNWLNSQKKNKNFNLLNRLVLRILGKAHYSPENTHHFALAIDNYTHFTSPIRRYADLIVHRLLEHYVFFVKEHTDNEREKLKNNLVDLCQRISDLEIKSIEIERKIDNVLFCKYMEKHIGEQFNGTIVGLQNFGMFVELENMIEGFVHVMQMDENDFFTYHEDDGFVGRKSGKKYSFGNKVKVVVLGVDCRLFRINLKIVSD